MATISTNTLKAYISADLNVIIAGVHGVGKTAKLQEACDQLGLKMKYYSASTLDPYTDLVGIPVPNTEAKTVEYYRPKAIDEAEIVFFDELNRADEKTLNTIFEITQFKSINGEPLPKLRVVVAAINPTGGDYTTEELDPALRDRFDIFLQADPEIDLGYFTKKFGEKLARAAVNFWRAYHASVQRANSTSKNKAVYLSPRRMEKIVAAYRAIPKLQTVRDSLPPEVVDGSIATQIFKALDEAVNGVQVTTPAGVPVSDEVSAIVNSSVADQRRDVTGKKVTALLNADTLEPGDVTRLLGSLAVALNKSKGAERIAASFGPAVMRMTPAQLTILQQGWPRVKEDTLRREMRSLHSYSLPTRR